jgi:hypothetical protein
MEFKLPTLQAISDWTTKQANTAMSYVPLPIQEGLLAAGRAVSPDLQAAYNAGTTSAQQNQRLVQQSELATAQAAQQAINAGYQASPQQQAEVTRTLQNYYNTQGTATNPPSIGGGPPTITPQD